MKSFFSLLIILSLFGETNLSAQSTSPRLRTEKDVVNFLKKYYFKEPQNDPAITYERRLDTAFYMSIDTSVLNYVQYRNSKKWIARDFNKDGITDLVFGGYINEEAKIIAFLSAGAEYLVQEFDTPFDNDAMVILNHRKQGNQIIIGFISPYTELITFEEKLHSDTLVFINNRFTDYQTGLAYPPIDTIEIEYLVSVRPIRDKLMITAEDSCFLTTIERIPGDTTGYRQQSLYRMKLSTDSVHALFSYCSGIPFRKLSNGYLPIDMVLDGYNWGIRVVYADGTVKKIYDHMGTGPIVLRELYALAKKIMSSPEREYIRKLK